jgi:hypothetical protein
MDESVKDDATDGSRFVRRIGFRRSRSGKRLWPTELKGRIELASQIWTVA